VGPGSVYLPRARPATGTPCRLRNGPKLKFLFLKNGDDPIPKFGSTVLWRRPDWLGPNAQRPPGAPRGTRWMPGHDVLHDLPGHAERLGAHPWHLRRGRARTTDVRSPKRCVRCGAWMRAPNRWRGSSGRFAGGSLFWAVRRRWYDRPGHGDARTPGGRAEARRDGVRVDPPSG